MSDSDIWVVEIHGPNGIKMVDFPDRIVQSYMNEDYFTDYEVAAWLAYMELQHDSLERKNDGN